ncbi:MAG: N-acetylneuraminate synthase family protein [Methylophilaceae bacterium]|nr:N-acetylneuraminate synthase family protein [Methylophilaceae bacterium]
MNQQISIIAEIAQGYEGKPELARQLLSAAAAGGANAAKYQLVYADELATPDYQYYDLFKSLEMADDIWEDLASYAQEQKIELHLDIFGSRSLALAEKLKVGAVKLHGTDIANVGLLKAVAASQVDTVLLGAGGAFTDEIEQALEILANKSVVLLLGFQGYPTPDETNQISRVSLFKEKYVKIYPNTKIGFADHADPDSPLKFALGAAALGAGAVVLEKHITLGKVMKLEDHEAALNPDEFFEFSQVIRTCASAVGSTTEKEDFGMSQSEYDYRDMIRRHVVAARTLKSGDKMQATDVLLKRTSSQNAVTDLDQIYGKVLKSSVETNMPITNSSIG